MKVIMIMIGLISILFNPSSLANATAIQPPIVTVVSDYEKEVKIALRKNTASIGTNCLADFILYPGQTRTIHWNDLSDDCKQAQLYLLDVTRWLTHSVLLKSIPAHCRIYQNKWYQVAVECR